MIPPASGIPNFLRSINSSTFTSDLDRQATIREAHALVSRLETAWDTSSRICMAYPGLLACVKTALDLGLFRSWLDKNDGAPLTADELHTLVPHCDKMLLLRILRHLANTNCLWLRTGTATTENASDEEDLVRYEMTPYVRGQVEIDLASQTEKTLLWALPIMMSLPPFFKSINYENPGGEGKDVTKYFTGGLSIWEYLQQNEGWADVFGRLMKATGRLRGDLTELVEGVDLTCESDSEVLLVDVGGNVGHDLMDFRRRFPNAHGRLILQDLPHVIETASQVEQFGIERMGYDFFTPQTVQGAKAYLLHNILHDWSDEDVKKILQNMKSALKRGYSKLLILDMVVSETDPELRETSFDWVMTIYGSGMESKFSKPLILIRD